MIELKHVTKTYDKGNRIVLNDITLNIKDGETLVLLGASGCGKTTLLKMINGLCKPTTGEVLIDKKDISTIDPIKLRRSIGYVFQETGLFPHMTIAENISIVLRLDKQPTATCHQRATELLELVNLPPKHFANRFPHELSGGQQQRVGVARALANNPEILLMDEPFAALDAITRMDLQDELIKLKQKIKKTIVFVTHDLGEALKIADWIAILNEGRLEQLDRCEAIVNSPKTDFVRDLFESYSRQIRHYLDFVELR